MFLPKLSPNVNRSTGVRSNEPGVLPSWGKSAKVKCYIKCTARCDRQGLNGDELADCLDGCESACDYPI